MFKTICIMFYPTSKRSQRWDAIYEAMSQWRESRPEPKTWNNSLRGYITANRRSVSRYAKGFTKLIILEREVKGVGTAKLTVGVKPDGEMVQYCLTAAQGNFYGCNVAT